MGDGPESTSLRERVSLYCVSPPGEAAWVTDLHQRQEQAGSNAGPSGTQTNIMKRSLDTEETVENRAEDAVMDTEMEETNDTVEKIKRQKASVATGSFSAPNSKVLNNLNLPIPSANGRA